MNILTISGSLREKSYNTGLVKTAELLGVEGVTFTHANIREIPLFDADLEASSIPEAVAVVKQQIEAADGVLIATPEYNFSYTGVLKNALDWASRGPVRPFTEKPVAVIGASTGNFGSVRAQTDLRRLLHGMAAHVLPKPELLVTQAGSKFDENVILIDEATLKIYRTLLDKFVKYVHVLKTL
ncbi:MAG: NAD(P)H-dependent oxidoreductase [Ignavibacteria bacterium]|nr:NAD(P)H-dependent oxidoreductase [Ignavibacteria bacterium]